VGPEGSLGANAGSCSGGRCESGHPAGSESAVETSQDLASGMAGSRLMRLEERYLDPAARLIKQPPEAPSQYRVYFCTGVIEEDSLNALLDLISGE
jgi:hypothetical protein